MVSKKSFRRRPGRARILPVNVVIAHRHEEAETEVEDGSGCGGDARPPTLSYRGGGGSYITVQMAHPATCRIALHSLKRLSTRPLIEQIGKIHPRTHRMGDRHIEARIDLHQVGFPHRVAPELHLRVAFQPYFAHQPLGLLSGVWWKGNGLAQRVDPTQRRRGGPPPRNR